MAQLGKYEVLDQMGTGAMGNVYRARDTTLDREVALKTIRTGAAVDPDIRQRFYREARACARLQHPNIITVYDLGEADNTAYIAMELLEGADFRRIIQERRPLPLELKLSAAVEVCEAIAHAHRHGVIHRDIKPSNLFLTDQGRAKVLDFGIARLPSSKLTVAGQILGTPNYMAPEQILARPSDGRADLFSAAVVFFELLTFAHPFQGTLVPRRIVQSDPDSLFDYDAGLPLVLEKIMARGLAKEPERRYQTGDEFATDLRAVLDAIRGNASATVSRVELPSERSIPVAAAPAAAPPPPPAVAAAVCLVPEGQDPQEWRLSEALRLLPEFEAAISRKDVAAAQSTVSELEMRLAGDLRFGDAIRLCRSRLAELMNGTGTSRPPLEQRAAVTAESAAPPPRPAPSLQIVEPPLPPSPAPRVAQPTPAPVLRQERPIDLDATLFNLSSEAVESHAPLDLPPPSEPVEPRAGPAAESLPAPPATAPSPSIPNLQRRKTQMIVAGAAFCALVVLIGGIVILRSVSVKPAVATAVVAIPSLNVFAAPDPTASVVASLPRGAQLNILRLPTAREQEWVNVQPVKPKVFRPGFAHVSELRDWQGRTGAAALDLIQTLGPGESGTDSEIESQIQDLNQVASRFPGQAAARQARLDVVRLRLAMARRRQRSGQPADAWQPEVQAAQQDLGAAGGDRDLQASLNELLQVVPEPSPPPAPSAGRRTPEAAKPVPPSQPSPVNVKELIDKARQLRADGDYIEAERVLTNVLRASPGNTEAQELLNRIKRSRDAE